ncbi:14 kDa proline-rich protein DC2.15 [Manihot esculenta]|uniref:Bifunctional inhibitor/plant lipid transfer protein/seed storage helical domain-containing protein n=1 Tax=Manihot esculenta TaxID=3983 RepID=A0A2C9WIU1_MANES|nr:14 kDa proline-rich protein DC2.15 [Manihot esculenta]OAY60007.1 hypothetical protein MANES_01G078800v8 [Manihot esculenta]
MGSRSVASIALLLSVNLLFFSMGSAANCPVNVLLFQACITGWSAGQYSPPYAPCCNLMANLVDLDAAFCLCTAIKADVLGISLNIPINLSLVLNTCGKKVPDGFHCP